MIEIQVLPNEATVKRYCWYHPKVEVWHCWQIFHCYCVKYFDDAALKIPHHHHHHHYLLPAWEAILYATRVPTRRIAMGPGDE